MTLRQRTILAVLAVCTVAIAVLYFAVQSILVDHCAKLERQKANDDLEQASAALNQDIASVETAVGVWAPWNDTYRFMQDRNQQYVASNLSNPTLVNLGVDFIVYVDTTGQIFYSKAVDASTGTEATIPSGLEQFVTGDGLLARHSTETSDISGILFLPEQLALVASQPILTSQKEGPIAGSLVMGRYLDSGEVQKLSKATGISIQVHRVDDSGIPDEFQAARLSLTEEQSSLVEILDSSTIAAYALVNEVQGNPAFVLGIDEPRDISAQARQTASHILYLLLGLSVAFAVLLVFGIDILVMSRLRRLRTAVAAAAKGCAACQQVAVAGVDEVSAAANVVHQALAVLDQSQLDLAASEARNRALVDAIPDLMFRMDREGKISETRKPQRASSDDIVDLIPPHIQQMATPFVVGALESKQTQIFEFQMSVDGSTSDHEARVVPGGDSDALIIVRDVTAEKHEEEAQQNKRLLSMIYSRVNTLRQGLHRVGEMGGESPLEDTPPGQDTPSDYSEGSVSVVGAERPRDGRQIEADLVSTTTPQGK